MKAITIVIILCCASPVFAARLAGTYVDLLAKSDDGRASAILDLYPEECPKLKKELENIGGFKDVRCVPIDYEIRNKQRR